MQKKCRKKRKLAKHREKETSRSHGLMNDDERDQVGPGKTNV